MDANGNFPIEYGYNTDGSLWTNFNIGVTVGGSLSSWQRANDRTSNFIYGLTNTVSFGLVDWAIAFDRRHGLGEHNEINPNSSDAQAGAMMAVVVPGPGGKLGVSAKGLKHIAKHLSQFQALNPRATLGGIVRLGQRIASNSNNLIGTPGGRQVFQQSVNIGGNQVPVRVVLNPNGGLRSIHIRQ